ncbi:MAG: 3TM-type holin [Prevotella sp.]
MGLLNFSLGDVGSVITGIREAITGERIKDPVEMAKIQLQLEQLDNALQSGQIEINKAEATNPNLFVAGARPFIMWVCGVALSLMFIPKAIVLTAMWTYQVWLGFHGQTFTMDLPPFPDLGVGDAISLLGAMLGVGAMRSYDKSKGTDTKVIGNKK